MYEFFLYQPTKETTQQPSWNTKPSGYVGKNPYQISQNSKEELHNYFWLNRSKATNQTQNSKYNQMAPHSSSTLGPAENQSISQKPTPKRSRSSKSKLFQAQTATTKTAELHKTRKHHSICTEPESHNSQPMPKAQSTQNIVINTPIRTQNNSYY